MDEVFGTVDITDDEQVSEYERYFYRAYARLADNKLVRLIWDWDDARQRTRTKISYSDQVIYTMRDPGGRLAGAMAVNLNCRAVFQGAAFGFTPPGGPDGGPAGEPGRECCEILNVMATSHHRATALATYGTFVRDFGYGDLLARGLDTAYSTCTPRRLRPYQRLGAQVLDRSTLDGEDRFFLRWPLRRLVSVGGHVEQVVVPLALA